MKDDKPVLYVCPGCGASFELGDVWSHSLICPKVGESVEGADEVARWATKVCSSIPVTQPNAPGGSKPLTIDALDDLVGALLASGLTEAMVKTKGGVSPDYFYHQFTNYPQASEKAGKVKKITVRRSSSQDEEIPADLFARSKDK